ncbi:MAG: hypothetical protein ACREEQ_05505, partial [Caulobacteraceae bacterium]
MAEHFGSLVGTPSQSSPLTLVDNAYARCPMDVIVRDTIALAAAPVADTIQAAVVGWDTVLDPDDCFLHTSGLGAGVTLSFGAAGFATALDDAVAVNAAGNVNLCSALGIGSYYQPLWQALGYASLAAAKAVANQCELLFTLAGAAATGTVT